MNFAKLYIGDYLRDTGTLALAQHGAYMLMLLEFYATERPLPTGRRLRLVRGMRTWVCGGVRVSPDNFIGALKTLRTEWLTIDEITIEFGCAYGTALKWVRAAMAHGMLVSTQGDKPEGRNGFPPAVYAVTKAWGGCA